MPLTEGDDALVGVDEYAVAENLPPGLAQAATNIDFTSNDAETRGGFVCLPSLGSQPFGSWASRTSASDANWLDVAYGNGLYVAVAETGASQVMTSPDGITWTSRTAAAVRTWNSVTFGNGLFVAVSSSGVGDRVMTSPDGITWTSRTSAADNDWRSVTYGNGVFVAVADSGVDRVMTSSNGTVWTSVNVTTSGWRAVTYGNGLFVAVANSGALRVMYSTNNGVSWMNSSAAAALLWNGVVYGNGLFVAVAMSGTGNRIMTSPDALVWTSRTNPVDNNWAKIAYGNGRFVAVSSTGTGDRVMTSTDGIGWRVSGTVDNSWNGVVFGNGLFVAVAYSGTGNRVMTSTGVDVFASGLYSDPNDAGSQWIVLVGAGRVGFYAFGRTARTVSMATGQGVSKPSTVVQCNNQVYIFRGATETPLYWDGNWNNEFKLVPATTAGAGFESIPSSNQAIYCQNRLWVKNGKDRYSASDILEFTTYDAINNDFNLNTGSSDFLVTAYPFGTETIIVFKNKSIFAINNADGALTDVTSTEITRQVGAIGINAVVSVGPDLVYMSDRNINLLSLTSTNNSVQHQTLPLSRNIRNIFNRVNWTAASKVSMGYHDNKLYVALPLDNATSCNTVCVYNFITNQWFGEWNFASSIGMAIQGWVVATYLGTQRMHAITEDGRVFVVDEGPNDISGTTVAEISTSLTTRAYRMNNENRVNRRMWMDLGTWRPSFSVTAYVDGANENEAILSAQTFARSQSWIFNDSTYTLTNANNDYNRAGRKDYASGPDSIQPRSGFQPEMQQDYRLPIITRRRGRLCWFKVTNTQGVISIKGVGVEARAGERSNLTQAI